jgi:hypothetical protein
VIVGVYIICLLNIYWFSSGLKMLYNKLFVHGEYIIHCEGDVAKTSAKDLTSSKDKKE